eukprot:jgi/Orpsp1_1/1191365/evm.model.d7180000085185.1
MIYILLFNFILYYLTVFTMALNLNVTNDHTNSLYYPSNKISFDYSNLKDIMIFGDSYSQTSTNYETFKYTGENFSGGKNWPLHLIEIHKMKMWNFASDGAPTDNSYINGYHPHSLPNQYKIFKKQMTEGKQFNHWESESSLFTFWFGVSDMINSEVSEEETIEKSLNVMFKIANKIYENGARNILFFNIPPLEKSPYAKIKELQYITQFVEKYNKAIKEKVKVYSKKHPEANVFLYDSIGEFNFIIKHHQKLNIIDTRNTCIDSDLCDVNRKNFFWYDYLNPTDVVHKYIADDLHIYLNSNSINKVELRDISSNIIDSFNPSESSGSSNLINKKNGQKYFYIVFFILILNLFFI